MEVEDFNQKAKIKEEIDNISGASITLENFRTWSNNIKNKDSIIASQIQGLGREYGDLNDRIKEIAETQRFKDQYEGGFVSRDIYQMQERMIVILSDVFSWKGIQAEMYMIMFEKTSSLMDETNAFQIKKDALSEMRDMEEKRNQLFLDSFKSMADMFKETVVAKFEIQDEKINVAWKSFFDQSNNDQKELLAMFERLATKLQTSRPVEQTRRVEEEYIPKPKPKKSFDDMQKDFSPKPRLKKTQDIPTADSFFEEDGELEKDTRNDEVEDMYSDIGDDPVSDSMKHDTKNIKKNETANLGDIFTGGRQS